MEGSQEASDGAPHPGRTSLPSSTVPTDASANASTRGSKGDRGALPKLQRGKQAKRRKRRKGHASLSPSRGGAPAVQALKFFPEDEISFPLEAGFDSVGTILIENTSQKQTYAYRVKTNAPDRYLVRPAMGLVQPKSSVQLLFVLRAADVSGLLETMKRAVHDATQQVPTAVDKFLVLTAEVDETNDYSTSEEVKELSTLWSTSRWKKKTQRKHFIAEHHRKIVVSSDSDSDGGNDNDTGEPSLPMKEDPHARGLPTVNSRAAIDTEPTVDREQGRLSQQQPQSRTLTNTQGIADQAADRKSRRHVPASTELGAPSTSITATLVRNQRLEQKSSQRRTHSESPIPLLSSTPSPLRTRSTSQNDVPLDAKPDLDVRALLLSPPMMHRGKLDLGIKASPRLQLEPITSIAPLIESPSASPARPTKIPSPGGRVSEYRSLNPLLDASVEAEREMTPERTSSAASPRPSTAPMSLKRWAKAHETTIAEFDSLPLSEKIKRYKELKEKTAILGAGSTKRAWGLKSEGAFSLSPEKPKRSLTVATRTSGDAVDAGALQDGVDVVGKECVVGGGPTVDADLALVDNGLPLAGKGGLSELDDLVDKVVADPAMAGSLDVHLSDFGLRLNVTEGSPPLLVGKAPRAIVEKLPAAQKRAFSPSSKPEKVTLQRSMHFVADFPLPPLEVAMDNPLALGSLLEPYHTRLWWLWWNLYDMRRRSVYNVDDCTGASELVSHNMFQQRYGVVHSPEKQGWDADGLASDIMPEVSSMDFIKSVVFLEKNLQQAQFAMLKVKDATVPMKEIEIHSHGLEVVPKNTTPMPQDHTNTNNAMLLLWYRLAKHRLAAKSMGESVPEFEVMDENEDLTGAKKGARSGPWSAPKALAFAGIRGTEQALAPYWDLVERITTLQKLAQFSKEQNKIETDDMRLRLAKASTHMLPTSPWGDASAAAKKIVQTKREEASRTSQKLAMRAMERTEKCGERLKALEKEIAGVVITVYETIHHPVWYLEWLCGVLQCDTEVLESMPHTQSYWWAHGYDKNLPRGWVACETSKGYVYFAHDDGRVQWETPDAGEDLLPLPLGWAEAWSKSVAGEPSRRYYYNEQDGRVQWEVPWAYPGLQQNDGCSTTPPGSPRAGAKTPRGSSRGGESLRTPRTPRTPRSSSKMPSKFYEIESPHGVKKMKVFTFPDAEEDQTPPIYDEALGEYHYGSMHDSSNTLYDPTWERANSAGYLPGYSLQLYSWHSYMRRTRSDEPSKPPSFETPPRTAAGSMDTSWTSDHEAGADTSIDLLDESLTLLDDGSRDVSYHDDDRDSVGDGDSSFSFTLDENRPALFVVRVIADYDASETDETEMDLRDGELLEVLQQDPSGWWEGRRERDGKIGWFPSNYVYVKNEIWTIYEEELEEGDEESAF